jgi:hypothetical protein
LERLAEDDRRERNWKRWGPYLSERQWGTVREDYSADGNAWAYFPHEHARSRAYRWGEDGLLGICDRQGRLCFALALWNERDAILKERLFGLTGPEGNHGEDCKEAYFYLDSTPTHSYMRALYKYPQAAFPYSRLLVESRRRGRQEGEFELEDTGVLDGRYFDVQVEYAKPSDQDTLIRITVTNRGPDESPIHVLPTLWFRNTWSWNRTGEGYGSRPQLRRSADAVVADCPGLGTYTLDAEELDGAVDFLFTENESNAARLWGAARGPRGAKDAFHDRVVHGRVDALNPAPEGTKAAAWYRKVLAPGRSMVLRLSLGVGPFAGFGRAFDDVFTRRRAEADAWHRGLDPKGATAEESAVLRQVRAGLLWTKQFFHYVVKDWLEGDPGHPLPPGERARGRNAEWRSHLYNRDVVSMPDKWEYPWYAAWDLAFHMIPFSRIDPVFARSQLELFVREWYMHPNGQIPAYEWNLSDVNPPVHAWAAWRVYKLTAPRGQRDRRFLAHVFQKLLMNFTWWVNRKDDEGNNLFGGGFLGLDNIGIFDRSKPLPMGGKLEQADGTAWMAFYCTTMLAIALELSEHDPSYEDLASKFFEHFVAIADAINDLGGSGLWDEEDGFYYDGLVLPDGREIPLKVRSMVGVIPLFAVEAVEDEVIDRLPGFRKRMRWFLENRPDLADSVTYMESHHEEGRGVRRLLAIPSRARLIRVLRYILDENEFLSPYGVRSLSLAHRDHPFVLQAGHDTHRVAYVPGESDTGMFGGNSNWRGPVWFPVNYLLIESLERYHYFYGGDLKVECPTGSGRYMTLDKVARHLAERLSRLFLLGEDGLPPFAGGDRRWVEDPHWRDLVLFHEYFHGDTGKGLGASHQTGWTALVAECIGKSAKARG